MRLVQFDALKLFAIYMVILGHCIQHLLSSNYVDEVGYIMIYSFHMPLFMMISGYFCLSSLNRDFLLSIATKGRQLLIPVLTASIVYTISYSIIKNGPFLGILDFTLLNAFWFLKTCFFCFVLARISYAAGKYKIAVFAMTLLLTQIPHIYRIDYFTTNIEIMYPCFIAGIAIRNYWDKIMEHSKSISAITMIIFIILLIFWSKEFWTPTYPILYKLKAGELAEVFYLAYLRSYKIFIGLTGSLFFITLFHSLIGNTKNKTIIHICRYGEYTIGIYIIQTFILETLMRRFINFDDANCYMFNLVIAPVLSILVLAISTYLSILLNRNKYSAFLFAGKKIK